jgi:peptidoglycan/LPS O-acetylase OafA/YrhL
MGYAMRPIAVSSTRSFVTLDGLRGLAAIAIAIRHVPYLWPEGSPTGILRESYLAVDFFFVLSGFVLCHAYGDRLRSDLSARYFMVVRLIRLYPLYLLGFVIGLALAFRQMLHGEIDQATLFGNAVFGMLFIPSPFSDSILFPLNGPAWSLFFELVINFVFGLFGARLNNVSLGALLVLAASVLSLAVWFRWFGFGAIDGPLDAGQEWSSVLAGFARVTYSFFAGVAIYRLWKRKSFEVRVPPAIPFVLLGVLLFSFPSGRYQPFFDLLTTVLLFPALVFFSASSTPGQATAPLFGWLGRISYAIYVLQLPCYGLFGRVFSHIGASGLSLVWASAAFLALILAAWMADDHYDRRARKALTALMLAPANGLRTEETANGLQKLKADEFP